MNTLKKIAFPLITLLVAALFQSCEDFNAKNFPGYDQLAKPTVIKTATYQLTNTDYKTIANAYKNAMLPTAATNADSASITATANSITNNLSFSPTIPASQFITYLMPTMYQYVDPGSAIAVIFRTNEVIPNFTAYSDSLVATDYAAMGTAAGKPGAHSDFSSSIDPNLYIPSYLKQKHPYAVVNEIARVALKWYVAPADQNLARFYQFDGNNWNEIGKTEQFIMANDRTWMFDPTITFVASKDDYMALMNYLYTNWQKANGVPPVAPVKTPTPVGFPIPELVGYNGWTNTNVGRFVINWSYPPSGSDLSNVRTEYFFGSSWYYPDFDIRSTTRVYADDVELQAYFAHVDSITTMSAIDKTTAKTTFMEQRVIQGLALLITLKYPNLQPQVKGIDQYVQAQIDEYTGSHNYWTYRYQCVAPGRYTYISRSKWK
jgi:hypothetical protein